MQRYHLTKCFVKLKERFERTANANYEKTARTHACSNQDRQIDIVGCAIQNPSRSIREISDEISISKSVVHRTLKKNNFHPYHPEHHQFLTEQDCQKRVQFSEWATIKLQDESFFSKVLFTDESSFTNTGRENRHNYHYYADQNPRLMRQDDHQHRFKVNVWAGICGEYRHIPPDDLNSQWFQHDGAPAHSSLASRSHSMASTISRSILSSFFLWGYIKDKVYETPPTDVEDLRAKIRNAFLTITPEMLRNVASNFRRRIAQCLDKNGRHFERLPVN
ncbi:hypothetical protein NQ315_005924 [Exocentrus adspersus]|uniref:Transposase Tc1-like domain-containing protein n=1 Tax=Exocentrus adspersus TaxID=1586481 RepID=A0AAV8VEG6_9CUCU|nr:hypothetical protein NQ315_005924 [Exocentrus adspersus]